jgi:menaquinone-dependent protoporphyrinogen oxidase
MDRTDSREVTHESSRRVRVQARSTKAIAERIARTLSRHGSPAIARPVEETAELSGYDAFVIGSAVCYRGWMKEAVEFVREHERAFAGRPVWLFSSGPVDTSLPADPKEIAVLRQATKPRDHRVFCGALDRGKLSFGERVMVGAVKAPAGDFRNWNEIEGWADTIAQELDSAVPVTA